MLQNSIPLCKTKAYLKYVTKVIKNTRKRLEKSSLPQETVVKCISTMNILRLGYNNSKSIDQFTVLKKHSGAYRSWTCSVGKPKCIAGYFFKTSL